MVSESIWKRVHGIVGGLVLVGLVGGCASMPRSMLLGAGIGAAGGAGIGAVARDSNSGATPVIIGGLIGAATGGLFGYLGFQSQEAKRGANGSTPPELGAKFPYLRDAKIQRIWIPDRIEGSRYIWGHYIDVIERPSGWGANDEQRNSSSSKGQ